jgi:phosphoribosylformimino-5-aminoimidazole carboxamide ribotide isomerase
MEIIPAIDIRGGKCVRLYQGDYNQETVLNEDPVTAALTWYSQGAQWLHVVDLDGAATGEPQNIEVVEEIIKESGLLVELGGGIRQEVAAGGEPDNFGDRFRGEQEAGKKAVPAIRRGRRD